MEKEKNWNIQKRFQVDTQRKQLILPTNIWSFCVTCDICANTRKTPDQFKEKLASYDVMMPFMKKRKNSNIQRRFQVDAQGKQLFCPQTLIVLCHVFAHARKTSVQFIEDWLFGYVFRTNYLQRPFCAEADLFPGVFILWEMGVLWCTLLLLRHSHHHW